jgi:hypothetical protein
VVIELGVQVALTEVRVEDGVLPPPKDPPPQPVSHSVRERATILIVSLFIAFLLWFVG